jgi:hypothetical protein
VGLGLTRRRLEQLYGSDATLSLRPLPGGGTAASLDLPLQLAGPASVAEPGGSELERPAPLLRSTPMTASRGALAILGGWALVYVAGFPTSLTDQLPRLPLPDAVLAAARGRAVEMVPWLVATPLVILWARWIATRVRRLPLLLAGHILGGAAVIAAQQAVYRAAGIIRPEYPPGWVTAYMIWGAMAYVAIATAVHVWVAQERYTEEALAGELLARDLAQAEVDAVSWRLQPDFIGGVLDDIAALAGTDPARADALTVALGDLMRVMLDGAGIARSEPDPGRELALSRGRDAVAALRRGARARTA